MATLAPASEDEIVDAVASARDTRRTLEIVGRGTKRGYGYPMQTADVLDVSQLSGIISYEPEELILTARAATPVAEIAVALAAKNQRLGFAPADWAPLYGTESGIATIGGAVSADASGPAAVRYGRARDHLLGYRAVNGFARAYKAGGKVVKNVTGFDLPKLMCGALGTLGVLTEVTLRTYPRSGNTALLVVRDLDANDGLALLRHVWSSALEATALSYVPASPVFAALGGSACLIRLEGAPEPLHDKIGALNAMPGTQALERRDDLLPLLSRIASGEAFAAAPRDVWRVFVPPSEAAALATELAAPLWCADWAGGVIWCTSPEDVHTIAARHNGHARLMRGRGNAFTRFSPQEEALTRSVKAAFDPLRLFNPGRMGEGL